MTGIIELDEVVARLSAIESRLAKIEEYLRPSDDSICLAIEQLSGPPIDSAEG